MNMQSWGRYTNARQTIEPINWRDQNLILKPNELYLPYGNGRSYGDSCLNDGGTLLTARSLNRFISFDERSGVLQCETGVTLEEILKLVIPRGFILPVLPGTKYVTVGGAIANDIHGKNHHLAGTFGHHVNSFELVRPGENAQTCSLENNSEMFSATIGGLGLTGLITKAELQLMPISSSGLNVETMAFAGIDEFIALNQLAELTHDYTAAWLDCQSKEYRGIFIKAKHCGEPCEINNTRKFSIPITMPSWLLNRSSISMFNNLYYSKNANKTESATNDYTQFFFPLDSVKDWNKIYGKNGFFQFQCIIPAKNTEALNDILNRIVKSGQGSFLSVLKSFGDKPSVGLMSFPRSGLTLALDFPNRGEETRKLLLELDSIVRSANGAIYPAKDAVMPKESFQQYFPNYQKFMSFIHPKFSSSFWRRVSE